MVARNQHKQPAPGRRVDVGGFSLHAQVMGEGSPAVVFEPALGAFGLQWLHIQPQVAEVTTTVAYDRAGQGWSDPGPEPRTPAQVTGQLHRLLAELEILPPYILVGHSFGGLLMRYYAHTYRDEVVGLVLVDCSHEQQYESLPGFKKVLNRTRSAVRLLSTVTRMGFIGRLFARQSLKEIQAYTPGETWEQLVYAASRPQHHETVLAEFSEFERYFGPATEIPPSMGDIPVAIITAGDSLTNQRPIGGLTGEELNAAHHELQESLLTLSPQSERIVVDGATHLSIVGNPEHAAPVVDAVQKLVKAARG